MRPHLVLSLALAVSLAGGARAADDRNVFRNDFEIYSVSVDGKAKRDLSRSTTEDVAPSVSPNGRRILFDRWSYQSDDPRRGIWLMNVDGSRKAKVTGPEGYSPTWSPDGTRIAVSVGHPERDNPYRVDVKIVTLADSHVTTIDDASNPTWSPDGTRLAFLSESISTFRGGWQELSTAAADGTNRRVVFRGPSGLDQQPAWAPRGNSIALTFPNAYGYSLHVVDARTGAERTVAREGWNPVWSPDGRRLAFSSYGGIGFTRVAQPGTHMLVRKGNGVPHRPAWSPDGRRIAFITGRKLRVVDVVTRRVHDVVRGGTDLSAPVWSPGGNRLYYAVRFSG